jgi:hypothetical protein
MRRQIQGGVITLLLIVFGSGLLNAQENDDLLPYRWEEAGIDLGYPTGWDEPLPSEVNNRPTLDIAQTLVDSPEARPPGIPTLQLTLVEDALPDAELASLLAEQLQAAGITPAEQAAITLAQVEGLGATGLSTDQVLFGVSRAVQFPDNRILIVTGRALTVQRDVFLQIYEAVSASIVPGDDLEFSLPEYGVLWQAARNPAEDLNAFVNLAGAATTTSGLVYTVDAELGLLRLDALTGDILAIFPNADLTTPADVTVDGDGTVYIADTVCNCIFPFSSTDTWGEAITGFGLDAPYSIVATAEGTLYATDLDESSAVSLRVLQGGVEQARIPLADQSVQPLLGIDRNNRVAALTVEGQLLILENGVFSPQIQVIDVPSQANDLAFNLSNQMLVATSDQGVLVLDESGALLDRLGRIAASYPLAGEVASPRGVSVGEDGTVYVADSDGTFGAITAFSTRVPSGRVGASTLAVGVAVQGELDPNTSQQTWTFEGSAGQQITISAVDSSEAELLDLSVRLLNPEGVEEAVNDNQEGADLFSVFDAQIANHSLQASGTYTVIVERVDGAGAYALGISQVQPFTLNTDTVTTLEGEIQGVFPKQRWTFQGTSGQVLTFTMQAESGTLDPLLRLIAPDDQLLAENDDADDPAISPNAQLVQVQLPADGMYILEAARFEGEGRYQLVIVSTAQ